MNAKWSDTLTPREKEVLLKIVAELNSREIALELGISSRTVENYRRNIIRKTKIRHVAGLVKYAIRQGWVAAYQYQDKNIQIEN